MDIASRLKYLEDMIAEAKTMPLSSSVLLNREEVLDVVREIRESLPEEIKQARWVVKDREELLTKARRDAEGLIQEALAEQEQLAAKEEVVRRAQQEAERILAEADEQGRHRRHEADDYIDASLAGFEAAIAKIQEALTEALKEIAGVQERLAKASRQVETGRQRLRGATIAEEELAPQAEGAE